MLRFTLVIGLAVGAGVVGARDQLPQAPPPRCIPIVELVAQLGSETFAEREAATKRLSELTLDPPSEVLAASMSENPDVRGRAAKAAQAMRRNVAVARLPRGQRFAEQGRIDLFVAATAVWDLRSDDTRLWVPAVDLGRRLIEKAEMTGNRKPQNSPSSYQDFDTFVQQLHPRFTRVNDVYSRQDIVTKANPLHFHPEAIQAAGVADPFGIACNLVVSRGDVEAKWGIAASVVFANGNVTAQTAMNSVVIVCDGDVNLTDYSISKAIIIARGNITAKRGANTAVLIAGGKVTLPEERPHSEWLFNVIKENEKNPLGYITFFELTTVGVEVKLANEMVSVAKVTEAKPFAAAGVKAGDIITAVNGKKPDNAESLRRLLRDALAIGDATITLKRSDTTRTVKVSLPE